MISQATAVSKHHFTDADESEDRIALSLVRSIQYTRKNLMTSLLTLCIILFVSAGLTVYQMHSGFSPAYTIISVVLLCLYVPRCVQVWREYHENSGIRVLSGKEKPHFLLCRAACTRKDPVSGNRYTLRVRCANDTSIEEVLVPRRLYDSISVKDHLILVMRAGEAKETDTQVLAFPSASFKQPERRAEETAFIPSGLRPLTEAEGNALKAQYLNRIRQRSRLYNRMYLAAILVCALLFVLGLRTHNDTLIYPPLFCLVLVAGIFLMNHTEDMHVLKNLASTGTARCVPGMVSERIHDSSQGYMTVFTAGGRETALRSRRREDYEWFHLNDRCLLVYIGEEKPIPFLCITEQEAERQQH